MLERAAVRLLFLEELPVRLGVQELVRLGGIRQLDAHEPSVAVGVLVAELGAVGELVVPGDDLAGERRVDVGDGLHRLHLGVRRVLRDLRAGLGRLVEDDLAERVLRVPRDAEGRLLAVDPGPVVLLVVAQVLRVALLRQVNPPFDTGASTLCAPRGACLARPRRPRCPPPPARPARTPSRFPSRARGTSSRWSRLPPPRRPRARRSPGAGY